MVTDDLGTMSLVEHLAELRRRLIITIAAVAVGTVIGFIFSTQAIDVLRAPLPEQYRTLYFLGPLGAFGAKIQVAFFVGVALAMPVILYQIWRFVTPGLTARERRLVWPTLIGAVILFALGILVGYAILPFALGFLLGFASPSLPPLLTIDEYVGFVSIMLLAFGVVMEFPILLIGLNRAGVLSYRLLAERRRQIIVGIVIFAIVVTPGGDPFSPLLLSSVMYALFEGSLLVMRRFGRS
ncbi:MAG TPA: twin-arginine translocase subunit TatC [Candidatus Limnocylindria bacterium]|nr:twin-arginine translocase subunit TatC [Candidatus Limnocylindria bacterium]